MPPKVSVLVPVYNVCDYLRECLDSILAQTFTDFEVICIDDGSTDCSPDILSEYCRKDERVKVFRQSNRGLPGARNAGLDRAAGEFISFVDADDTILPNMLEKLVTSAEERNAQIVICGAQTVSEYGLPEQWGVESLTPDDVFYPDFTPDVIFKNKSTRPFLWRILVRKSLVDKFSLRLDESIVVGEDNAFQFRLYPKAERILCVSDKLYRYRIGRPGSIISAGDYDNFDHRVEKHIQLGEHIASCWGKGDELSRMHSELTEWATDFLFSDFVKVSLCEKSRLARRFIKMLELCGWRGERVRNTFHNKIYDYLRELSECEYELPLLSVAVHHTSQNIKELDKLIGIAKSVDKSELVIWSSHPEELLDRVFGCQKLRLFQAHGTTDGYVIGEAVKRCPSNVLFLNDLYCCSDIQHYIDEAEMPEVLRRKDGTAGGLFIPKRCIPDGDIIECSSLTETVCCIGMMKKAFAPAELIKNTLKNVAMPKCKSYDSEQLAGIIKGLNILLQLAQEYNDDDIFAAVTRLIYSAELTDMFERLSFCEGSLASANEQDKQTAELWAEMLTLIKHLTDAGAADTIPSAYLAFVRRIRGVVNSISVDYLRAKK